MRARFLLIPVAVLSVAVVGWWGVKPVEPRDKLVDAPIAPVDSPQPGAVESRTPPVADAVRSELDLVWVAMNADASNAKSALDALALRLRSMPREAATAAIREFLDGRKNAATRMPFAVGDGGNLATAPTLRVWLLDQLGQVNPAAAADYAQGILGTRESAEEWAVALRDFARVRTGPADGAFLSGKMRELLSEPRWQVEASVGWLEAFDVAVHLRDTTLAPELSRLLTRTEKQDKPAAFAAYLTLDRLVLAEPTAMLGRLQAEPELMQGREQTRANYFARADVRDPQQRALVEAYLADPRHSPEELAKFTGLYPNANRMISKNLLTPTETPTRESLAAHDREALAVVTAWVGDARFQTIRPALEETRRRLEGFVRQAGQ